MQLYHVLFVHSVPVYTSLQVVDYVCLTSVVGL